MKKKKTQREIVLYNGSLEELNSRSEVKYKFATKHRFCTEQGSEESLLLVLVESTNFDGLVNFKTSHRTGYYGGSEYFFEGTPILRKL